MRRSAPLRSFLERFLRLLLRIFFRRIEIAGTAPSGSVVYALNHPNALVDPMFILCFAPQRVSFLAKEPVFRMPFIGALVRAFDSLPVYRRQDGADPAGNRRTLDAARDVLARGGAIALFPEGTSHGDPRLRRLRTGAARIALAANARRADGAPPIPLVPVGLHYTAAGTFRSQALVTFGAPIDVDRVALDDELEPPSDAALALTAAIERALAGLTIQADTHDAIALATRAERVYSAAALAAGDTSGSASRIAEALARRQRLIAGHAWLARKHPDILARLEQRLARHEDALAALRLDPDHPSPEAFTWRRSLRFTLENFAALLVLVPVGLAGALLHAPAYQLIRFLAFRIARTPDMPATVKLLGALLFFPLTWLAAAGAAAWLLGPIPALAVLLAAPLSGLAALFLGERLARTGSAARSLWLFVTRRRLLDRLAREREAIRGELAALGDRLDAYQMEQAT